MTEVGFFGWRFCYCALTRIALIYQSNCSVFSYATRKTINNFVPMLTRMAGSLGLTCWKKEFTRDMMTV